MDISDIEGMLHPSDIAQGTDAVNQATPEQVDAHRGLLGEAFQMLEQQGGSSQQVAQAAQVQTTDSSAMNPEDMVRSTIALARSHPQIVEEVASRYPAAQSIVGAVLGSAANAPSAGAPQNQAAHPGGDMFGGLLGKFLGS